MSLSLGLEQFELVDEWIREGRVVSRGSGCEEKARLRGKSIPTIAVVLGFPE